MSSLERAGRPLYKEAPCSLTDVVGELAPPGATGVVLQYRLGPNVGDAAIQLGQQQLLEDLGIAVAYACTSAEYTEHVVRRHVGKDGILFISGGGSLGDFHRQAQFFKEKVVRGFPHNRIVVLPQSVIFTDHEHADRAGKVFRGHGDLHVLCRDIASLEALGEMLGVKGMLTPDMATYLDYQEWEREKPSKDALWLIRSDVEQPDVRKKINRSDFIKDWPGMPGYGDPMSSISWKAIKLFHRLSVRASKQGVPRAAAFQFSMKKFLTLNRFRLGMKMISEHETVVTDRLHGLVLGRMCGRKVFVLDNKTGKVGRFFDTWYLDDPDAVKIQDFSELPREYRIESEVQG